MDEKEILTTGPSEEEAKKAAMAQMENIFEQVSVIKAEEVKTAPKEEESPQNQEETDANQSNKTEIELITRQTLTDEEKQQQEQAQEEKRKKKNLGFFFAAVVCIFMAVAVVLSGFFYVDYRGKHVPGKMIITIPEGAGTEKIAGILKEKKLIHSEFFFKVMSRIQGHDGKYQYGKFEVNKSGGYEYLFDKLTQSGDVLESVKVTIPEGYEIYKVADLLEEKGLIDKDKFYYLIDHGDFDYDFVKDIPQREMRLEGYLFPDTYYFVPGDEEGIINEMLGRFEEVYGKYEDDLSKTGMTMDEIITLASIIEREAGSADKKMVSSVFHNRLESADYPYLQSCATVQYVLRERKPVLSYDDTQIDSPYNTYINKGLPVGPIASPGEESIEAALNPDVTNYYFFVLGSDGKHHFSETYNEHLNNKN